MVCVLGGRNVLLLLTKMQVNANDYAKLPKYVAFLLNCAVEVKDFKVEDGTLQVAVVVHEDPYMRFYAGLELKAGFPKPGRGRRGRRFQQTAEIRVESVPAEYAALVGLGLKHVAAIAPYDGLQDAATALLSGTCTAAAKTLIATWKNEMNAPKGTIANRKTVRKFLPKPRCNLCISS